MFYKYRVQPLVMFLLFFMGQVLYSQQDTLTVFDPEIYESLDLPIGMEIVDLDGDKYLRVILDQWNSVLTIDTFINSDFANTLQCEAKYAVGTSGYDMSEIQLSLKFIKAGYTSVGSLRNPAKSEFTTFQDAIISSDTIRKIQVFGQETNSWQPLSGDTAWIGKIISFYVPEPTLKPDKFGCISKSTKGIVLDGFIDAEYLNTNRYTINRICYGNVSGVYPGELDKNEVGSNEDSYGTVRTMWDNENLYIHFEIVDDDFITISDDNLMPWNNDGVEIYLAPNFKGLPDKILYRNRNQFRINSGMNGSLKPGYGMPYYFDDDERTNVDFVLISYSSYYLIELVIPWISVFKTNTNTTEEAEIMAKDSVRAGFEMGFELVVIDANAPNSKKSLLNWSNNTGRDTSYATDEFWGEVKLVEAMETPKQPRGLETCCKGDPVVYKTDTVLNAVGYEWLINPENAGNFTSNGPEATIEFDDSYTGDVRIHVRSLDSCGSGLYSEPLIVSVNQAQANKITESICSGDSLLIGDIWQKEAGVYTLSLISVGGCDSVVETTLNVSEIPEVDLGNDTMTSSSVVLDAGPGFTDYYWSTDEIIRHITVYAGGGDTDTQTIWVFATDEFGCTGIDTIVVQSLDTRIDEVNKDAGIGLFPNPATDELWIELNRPFENISVTIHSLTGTILQTEVFEVSSSETKKLNVSELMEGVYILVVVSDEEISTSRFTIKR